MVGVDLGRLGDKADGLFGVLLDVFLRAGADEVDFEVCKFFFTCLGGEVDLPGAGEVPVVDVVCTQVFEGTQAGGCVGEVSL